MPPRAMLKPMGKPAKYSALPRVAQVDHLVELEPERLDDLQRARALVEPALRSVAQ